MAKKTQAIILIKKRTRVEITDFDGWMFDIRYLINGKENHYAQIIKSDVPGRVAGLQKEGFIMADGGTKKRMGKAILKGVKKGGESGKDDIYKYYLTDNKHVNKCVSPLLPQSI